MAIQRCIQIIKDQKKEVSTKKKTTFFGKNISLEKEIVDDIQFVLENVNNDRIFEQKEFTILFSFFRNMAEALHTLKRESGSKEDPESQEEALK